MYFYDFVITELYSIIFTLCGLNSDTSSKMFTVYFSPNCCIITFPYVHLGEHEEKREK